MRGIHFKYLLLCLLASLLTILVITLSGSPMLKNGQLISSVTTLIQNPGVLTNLKLWVIPPKFDDTQGFIEGLATVLIDGKRGYIDKQGNQVIPAKFDCASEFSEGLAAVNIGGTHSVERNGCLPGGGKWGYINKQGKVVIPIQFGWASSFTEGLGRVKIGDKWGFIDILSKGIT